jgi:RNA polymerase sigma factor (sigma-70 family)
MCARRLIDQQIEFMYHPSFESPDADSFVLGPVPAGSEQQALVRVPPGLPTYLAQLYSIPLLTKEQETYYFRKMNYLKFKAARLGDQLDLTSAKSRVLDQIAKCQDEATAVKNVLIRSNLRLVVSIAKRHVKRNGNFFEMVSDGNISLIRAIEKFDFSRGIKFSTYATLAIMKNFARSIPSEIVQLDRYRTGNHESFLAFANHRSDEFEQEKINNQQRDVIIRILDQLDERERTIITYRFGLNQDGEQQTLEELSGRFGVTKERIRQLEARALGKLRRFILDEKLDIPGV